MSINRMNWNLKRILDDIGIRVKPGQCELYPQFNRPRRLPLGADQHVNSIPFLRTKAEQLQRFIEAIPIDLTEVVNSFNNNEIETADDIDFDDDDGDDTETDDDSLAETGTCRTRRGVSEHDMEAKRILKGGLTAPSTRYAAEKLLIEYYWKHGHTEEETYDEVEQWYTDGKTNGFSKEWARSPDQTLHHLRSHVKTYYEWLRQMQIHPVHHTREKGFYHS